MAGPSLDELLHAAASARRAGDRLAAGRYWIMALEQDPRRAEALAGLGTLALEEGRLEQARALLEAAVASDDRDPAAHNDLGNAYRRLGCDAEAIGAYEAALARDPSSAAAWNNLAAACRATAARERGLEAARRAIALDPALAPAHATLGALLIESRDPAGAVAPLRAAVSLAPAIPEFHANLATALSLSGAPHEALGAFEAALALRPDYAEAHANYGLTLVQLGDYARGWDELVWMIRKADVRATYPYLDRKPVWDGAPFPGERLLIPREQGFGDNLMLLRFVPLVKARGGVVIYEVAPELAELIRGTPGIDELRVWNGTPLPLEAFDRYAPALALPRAFLRRIADVPADVPYVRAPAERLGRWRERLARQRGAFNVGIAWAAGAQGSDVSERNAPAESFDALALEGVRWFALQLGPRRADVARLGALRAVDLGAEIADFADTAAIVSELDLVITVDTALAHLAGALGRPVWTLLPEPADPKWMLARDDSPWYPTMRLFRQTARGAWTDVFARVREALTRERWTRGSS